MLRGLNLRWAWRSSRLGPTNLPNGRCFRSGPCRHGRPDSDSWSSVRVVEENSRPSICGGPPDMGRSRRKRLPESVPDRFGHSPPTAGLTLSWLPAPIPGLMGEAMFLNSFSDV